MDAAAPSLVVILTGHLPAIIGVAAILTWPIGLALLALYRRAVRRSMGGRASGGPAVDPSRRDGEATHPVAPVVADARGESPGTLIQELLTRPRRVGWLYAWAVLAFAIVMTLVTTPFVEPGAPFRPVRFLLLTTMFAAPVVPVLAIVCAATRRRKLQIAAVYAAAYLAIVVVATILSPEFSVAQGVVLWTLYNLPGVALAGLCLGRRIRAVGPLVFLFVAAGLLGADAAMLVASTSASSVSAAVTVGEWLALGGTGTFLGILALGFVVAAAISVLLLFWIRRRYEAKRISDESLTVDMVMWLFAFGDAIGLAFEHPVAPLGGVAAMIAFTAVLRVGRARVPLGAGAGAKLLLLRSFSIGARGERLFDALEKYWRRVGSIHLIAGYDLATRTAEPHECLDFLAGRLSRRFITGRGALARRLEEMDTRPDHDGRFRVNDFFCYSDTWRTVLLALLHQSDAVLMDLRGFSRRNAGCVYEIGELFKLLSLDRVLFVVDAETDSAFLDETFASAAAAAAAGSAAVSAAPGRAAGAARGQPHIFRCESLDQGSFVALLTALAVAARRAAGNAGP